MTIDEAAAFLFVSRAHVRRSLETGSLQSAQSDNGECIIDPASVEWYKVQMQERAREFFRSQTEDDAPVGL